MDKKKCYICEEEKEVSEFYIYTKTIKTKSKGDYQKTYYYTRCKECSNKMTMKYLKDNPDKRNESHNKWRNKNIEKTNKYSAVSMKKRRLEKSEQYNKYISEYKEANKEKIKENRRNSYHSNIQVSTRHRVRSKIRESIKRFLVHKKDRYINELGCFLSEYLTYIEKQFKEGMTWDNWDSDTWHIDHIIPCCKFDLSDEQQILKCFHYSNTQPLWKKENLSKNRVYLE